MEEFNFDLIKMGYFIVYKKREGFHPFEKLIIDEQLVEGFSKDESDYVHVEISGGGNEAVSARFPRVRAIKIMKEHKGRYIKIVAYKASKDDTFGRAKVAYYAATMCNRYYGLISLLWFKLNDYMFKDRNFLASRHTPFCSLAGAWSLKKVYNESFESSGKIMPSDFLNSEKFEVVWEGYLK